MEEKHKKSFLEEMQSLEEPAKRRILIVATIVVMIVVIYIWLGYFNSIVASGSQTATISTQTQSASVGSGFWNNLKTEISHSWQAVTSFGQYTIHPQ